MNLNIKSGTAGYNNEILVSDSRLSLRRDDMVNTSALNQKTPIALKHSHKTSITPKHSQKEAPSKHTSVIMHEDEKVTLVLILTTALGTW